MHEHKHTDPLRLPHLQAPIEREMEKIHTVGMHNILVDVTRLLVAQTKDKK